MNSLDLSKEIYLNNVSREQFQKLEYFEPIDDFNSIIIVPTNDIHESNYRCMKFVLAKLDRIVGVVGGDNDIIHLKDTTISAQYLENSYNIDCLKKSGYIRIFADKYLHIVGHDLSDLFVSKKEQSIYD